ncbi:MAG: hypothetical protein P1Q69_20700, partial [Candidatus Thorarchaeota archaeon]|nr:hypothetical protein [Candidatus Thorarchaeota archaeon]
MKPVIMTVGVAMLIGGAIQCGTGGLSVTGIPSMLFGLDMITSNTIGKSVLDESLKSLLWAGL